MVAHKYACIDIYVKGLFMRNACIDIKLYVSNELGLENERLKNGFSIEHGGRSISMLVWNVLGRSSSLVWR